ncbi:MAG: CoA-binding protein [Syntrophomonadaceae bacterium]|nr:CoA-binding protein [Syntrophomonadaceae bacterium]
MDTGNLTQSELIKIIRESRSIAVVGLSANPNRDSFLVAAYLQRVGYRIIPVNPFVAEVLGEKAYPTLKEIPPNIPIDIVDVFRRSEEVPQIVQEAVSLKNPPRLIWLQLGADNKEAAEYSRNNGIPLVMHACLRVEHARLMKGEQLE